MSTYSVGIIRDAPGLSEIAPAWNALWNRAAGATPFQSPLWLIPWWRAFEPGELFTIAVWRQSRSLVGLAPLYLETGPLGRRLLPLGISLSDYLDVLIDPEWFEPAARALGSQLTAADAPWDSCELGELAPEANALRLPCPADWRNSTDPSQTCPVLNLPDDEEGLRSVLPRRKVRNVRMAWNRARRRGMVKIRTAHRETAHRLLCDFIRLHQARRQRLGESGMFADARVERFHQEAFGQLIEAGFARLYALDVGGSTIGAYYGFVHRGRALAYAFGFDPDWAFESPGTILIWHAMADAIREGAREFDFLRGRESYKYGWGAQDRCTHRRTFRRPEIDAHAC
jgi:CelD/BcsL family acetyltransferase involved in cellulose biosynthesis